MSQQSDPHLVTIRNVRLSYPCLFTPRQGRNAAGQPEGKAAYSASFILDKVANKADIDRLTAAAIFTKKEKWQDKPVNLKYKSIRDGGEKAATDGYGDKVVYISTRHTPKDGSRPKVLDEGLNPVDPESGKVYAGCYVDAIVRCWAQDNPYGKCLNWDLKVVQFRRKGAPFGEKPLNAEEFLEKLPEDDSAVDSPAGTSAI